MRRSGVMIALTIGTVMVSLVIFGFFLYGTANLQNITNMLSSKLEIRIFLKDNLTMQEVYNFENTLLSIKDISNIRFVHKDDAWTEFKKNFHNLELKNTINDNPLPHAYIVYKLWVLCCFQG